MTDTTIQLIWIVASHERMRLLIDFAPELASLVRQGEQFMTVRRTQRTGNTSTNGDFVEASAVLANYESGLLIGLHRKMWVKWGTPAEEPTINYSRFYTTLFGLPKDLQQPLFDTSARVVSLVQYEKFAEPGQV